MKSLIPISQAQYDKLPLGKKLAYDLWYEMEWFNKVSRKRLYCWGTGHKWYKMGDGKTCSKCGKLDPPLRFKLKEVEDTRETKSDKPTGHIHGCGHPVRPVLMCDGILCLLESGWLDWRDEHNEAEEGKCICFFCWKEKENY